MKRSILALATALATIAASAQTVERTDTVVKNGKAIAMTRRTTTEIVDGKRVVIDSLLMDGRFVGLTRNEWTTYEGKPMPKFEVKSETGETITSESLMGKTVAISFWITSCGPCLKELNRVGPEIIDQLPADKFVFLAIGAGENAEHAADFRKRSGATFPLCYDETGNVMPLFASPGCPKVFVIGPDGIVRFAEKGYNDANFERLKQEIAKAMAQEAE